MVTTYSTSEAKSKFSEVIRNVRDGETVLVSYRGEPVAEIRPLKSDNTRSTRVERMRDLERRGVLVRSDGSIKDLKPVANRPGALERFLKERHGCE